MRLGPEDQAATLPTLLNTNNWIFVALAGKTESTTTPLLANPYNGNKGVDFYWTRTDPGIMEIPLLLRLIYAVDGC